MVDPSIDDTTQEAQALGAGGLAVRKVTANDATPALLKDSFRSARSVHLLRHWGLPGR